MRCFAVTEHTSYEYGDPVHNPRKLRYRPAEADDMERQSLCNLMIMEYCDMGTLSAAVRVRGLVHSMSPQRTLTVSMWRLLMVSAGLFCYVTILLDTCAGLDLAVGHPHC